MTTRLVDASPKLLTAFGGLPHISRSDPADFVTDRETDAANIVVQVARDAQDAHVTFDDECLAELAGEYVVFRLPAPIVRVKVGPHDKYPDMLAKEALEEAGRSLLGASRATEMCWRDMLRVLKS